MAGAIGAAMCAFVGLGVYQGFEAVREIITVQKKFLPNQKNFDIYDEMFHDYQNLYKALRKNYAKSTAARFKKK